MSTPIPVMVGTAYKDSIYVKNKTTNAPVTGLVQADFTIALSRGTTGNVSTTGITLTEVSAANNPGQYDIVSSASTSFSSTTAGKYFLTLRRTSDDAYTYEQTILVTADGAFSGTSGAASFTATASDGRITDGVNPVTGATIRLINSANQVIGSVTSDASGLWGPVFLDSTVTLNVQKSGYTVSTAYSITVSGSTATGPLTDISLGAISSSLTLVNSDLTAYARVQARNVNGSQADTTLQQIVNDAIAWVATSKFWEFYKTYGDLTLREPYSTGTLAISNASTTVTLTGGTFPSWAASGKLKIGNKVYRIASRTSGSVVVLATAWAEDAETAATFTIFQDEYTLASDCLKFGRPFAGQGWGLTGSPSSFEQVLEAQNSFMYGQGYPSMFCVHASGGTPKLLIYPYPSSSEDVQLAYWYYRKPAALVNSSDVADFDPLHLELLHRAIDYQTAMRFESCVAGTPEACLKRLDEAYKRFAANDKAPMNTYGPVGQTGIIKPRLGG